MKHSELKDLDIEEKIYSIYSKYKMGKIIYGVRRIVVTFGETMMEGDTRGYWDIGHGHSLYCSGT